MNHYETLSCSNGASHLNQSPCFGGCQATETEALLPATKLGYRTRKLLFNMFAGFRALNMFESFTKKIISLKKYPYKSSQIIRRILGN